MCVKGKCSSLSTPNLRVFCFRLMKSIYLVARREISTKKLAMSIIPLHCLRKKKKSEFTVKQKTNKKLKLYSAVLDIASQGVIDIKCLRTATTNKTRSNRMFR